MGLKELYEIRRLNLERLVKETGTKSAAAARVGLSPQYFGKLVNGDRPISDENKDKIEKAFNLKIDALDEPPEDFANTLTINNQKFRARRIPIVSYVQAGYLSSCGDEDYSDWLTASDDLPPNAYALRVDGDSMNPVFYEGDLIIVDPDRAPKSGDYVIGVSLSGVIEEATFKQYVPIDIDEHGNILFELRPLNPKFLTYSSERHKLEVRGVVVEHRHKF